MNDARIAALLDYLTDSPTPFDAVANAAALLEQAGFTRLDERAGWVLQPDGRYYVTRNDTSLVAFRHPADAAARGWRMIGAHTDSPCLRLKPAAVSDVRGHARLAVEPYGGVLMNPWFDRDLGLSGRVTGVDAAGRLVSTRIRVADPVAFIPSLAIHLDRDANNSRSVNPQLHLPALLATPSAGPFDFTTWLLGLAQHAAPAAGFVQVLDHELSLFDTQPARVVGLQREFIASARLDNLLSCWCAIEALCGADPAVPALVVLNDHEEVGSTSMTGAHGPFLADVLERVAPDPAARQQALRRSLLVSSDNAHALHPNHADKHEPGHGPLLGGGPVIKVNANQRYASNSETQACFRQLADREAVPVQVFVTRSDLACGTTIGPITAAALGVRTVDVGIPQLGMHSIRELCATADVARMRQLLTAFAGLAELP